MMAAMSPTASDCGPATIRTKELDALEQKVKRLEIEKRRLEHLLVVATKIVQSGPLTTGRGRPPKRRSAAAGPTASPGSKPAAKVKTKMKRVRPSNPKPSAPAH